MKRKDYWTLFWDTGLPEAWALSRRSRDKPEAAITALSGVQIVSGYADQEFVDQGDGFHSTSQGQDGETAK